MSKPARKKPSPPLKSGVGVEVRYCGHDASFIADVVKVGNAYVVAASGPISDRGVLRRPASPKARLLVVDFPAAGYWNPNKGIFVVPDEQLRILASGEEA